MPYKKTNKTPQEIARELSANYLLTATIRWQKDGGGSRVQVNPELVEIKSDGPPATKWQQPFNAVSDRRLPGAVRHRLEGRGIRWASRSPRGRSSNSTDRPTQNLAAYDAYLKGEEASAAATRNDPASLRRALPFYEQAVALDPAFAVAGERSPPCCRCSTPTPFPRRTGGASAAGCQVRRSRSGAGGWVSCARNLL